MDVALLIACLGIGTGLAIPRQARIASDVRRAEVESLARSASTAADLAHARWLAADHPATVPGVRGAVALVQGYPSPASLPLLFAEAELGAFTYSGGTWQHREAGADCAVRYAPPSDPDGVPAIQADTSGC